MAVYNSEKYINEAIDSVIAQDLDFEENVQLILVNDGSDDKSFEICLEYQEEYPNNIEVVNQEHLGVACARNAGLKYATGDYVNFLDSDDVFSKNVLFEVYNFFKKYSLDTDIVAIPMVHIDRESDVGEFNYKFDSTGVVNLLNKPDNPQFSISSVFIKSNAIKEDFCIDLVSSEDTFLIYKILLEKKTLGILNLASYYYRKRISLDAVSDTIEFKKDYYTDRLKKFHLKLIDYCKSKEADVPRFIQYMLIYDLKSMVEHDDLFMCDDINEENELFECIKEILRNIDEEVILNNYRLSDSLKYFLYGLSKDDCHVDYEDGNVLLKIGGEVIDSLKSHRIWIDHVGLNGNTLNLYGSFSSYFDNKYLAIEGVKLQNNGKKVAFASSYIDYNSGCDLMYLSKPVHFKYHFHLNVPFTSDDENIMIKLIYHKNADKTDFSDENTVSFYLDNAFSRRTVFSERNNVLEHESTDIVFKDNAFVINKIFKFAIVVAIYNTEDYLHECIDSVINQTIGFEENVQLILVNDGSDDGSLEVLQDYKEHYPDNILIINQENAGQASARNNGLNHVQARYVNFLDSDDYLAENALEEVYSFFEEHKKETDIVSIPIQFFEKNESPHVLNAKYDQSRVVDLNEEPNNPQLSASSAFFKSEVVSRFNFPTNVIFSEDVILINKILLEKRTLGLVNSTIYFYRKRYDESSTIDTVSTKKEYFIDKLRDYFIYLFDYAKSKVGHVPDFLQYTLAYDLQWIFHQDLSILNKQEIEEFWFYLRIVVKHIGIDGIMNNPYIRNPFVKCFFLSIRKNDFHHEIQDNNVLIKVGNHVCDRLAGHKLWLDIVELRDGFLNISGFFNSLFDFKYISIEAIKQHGDNIERFRGRYVKYTARPDLKFLSQTFQYRFNFDINIPVYAKEKSEIKIKINYHENGDNTNFKEENLVSLYLPVEFLAHAKLSKLSNYKVNGSNLIYFENNTFYLIPTTLRDVFDKEKSNIKAIEEEMETVDEDQKQKYKDAIKLRKAYLYTYPIFKFLNRGKQVCLFEDRIDIADDNATHLFRYANKIKDNAKKYFVLSKDSKQFGKVSKMGKILKQNSFKHRLMMFYADKIISSHPYESVINPFYSYENDERYLYAGLLNYKIYFLQHGVTLGNISSWMSKFDKNLALLVTVAHLEYESFFTEGYGYDDSVIQKLGFPRFDNLKNIENKQILIIPSWRKYLKNNKNFFINSDYFKNINSFLNNPLLADLNDNGYKIVFRPHWELTKNIGDSDETYCGLLDVPEFVDVSIDDSYQDLFNNSSVMITDYSSVFFDFAYLKKPLIYYQPRDDYHYDDSYFDFDIHGFGDVVSSEEDLVEKLKWYVENDCKLEEKYIKRVDDFFIFNDRNNCKRVYDWIYEH